MSDNDETHGVVGLGLARVLGLCGPLKIADCPTLPKAKEAAVVNAPPPDVNLTELASRDLDAAHPAPVDTAPRIDLLGATAEGAPNVVNFFVNRAQNMGFKELDDNYVGMNLELAQQLLYGRGEHKAVSIDADSIAPRTCQPPRPGLRPCSRRKVLRWKSMTSRNFSRNTIRLSAS